MKRIIITGGTGFVGANLVRRLLLDGHEIHLLVRPGYAAWRLKGLSADVRFHKTDLGDADSLSRIFKRIKPDWIFHLAAHGAYSWQSDLHRIMETNITGTINLVQAALSAGFEALVNTGSSSEYGFKDHAARETELPEPNSYYAFSKAAATLFCRYSAQAHKVNISTLRLYSVYGSYENPGRLIPALIVRGLKGNLPRLVRSGVSRDFVYIDDVTEAYILAACKTPEEYGAVYNVGTGVQTSIREIVRIAKKVLDIRERPQWGSMPDRQWDTDVWVADNRKIRDFLGWKPCHDFESGFRATVSWFKTNSRLLKFYEAGTAP